MRGRTATHSWYYAERRRCLRILWKDSRRPSGPDWSSILWDLPAESRRKRECRALEAGCTEELRS